MLEPMLRYIVELFRQDPPTEVVTVKGTSDENVPTIPIEDMTKGQIDELGKANGVRLDCRRRKGILVAKMKEAGIHHG